jgi:hypothetical protein
MSQIVDNNKAAISHAPLVVEPAPAATEDYSEIIELVLPSQPNEEVVCKHLFAQFYRCNWYVEDQSTGIRCSRISRSKFVHVVRTEKGLRIDDDPLIRK